MKTRKAITKRIKITKNKKLVTRPAGQDHFRSRKSGKKIRSTHGNQTMADTNLKFYIKGSKY